MIQACKHCHKQYDNTKQTSLCPHKEFPKECEKHRRYNCGNPECSTGKKLAFVKIRDEVA